MALWLARLDCNLTEQRLIVGTHCAWALRPDKESVYHKEVWSDMGAWTKRGSRENVGSAHPSTIQVSEFPWPDSLTGVRAVNQGPMAELPGAL